MISVSHNGDLHFQQTPATRQGTIKNVTFWAATSVTRLGLPLLGANRCTSPNKNTWRRENVVGMGQPLLKALGCT